MSANDFNDAFLSAHFEGFSAALRVLERRAKERAARISAAREARDTVTHSITTLVEGIQWRHNFICELKAYGSKLHEENNDLRSSLEKQHEENRKLREQIKLAAK